MRVFEVPLHVCDAVTSIPAPVEVAARDDRIVAVDPNTNLLSLVTLIEELPAVKSTPPK